MPIGTVTIAWNIEHPISHANAVGRFRLHVPYPIRDSVDNVLLGPGPSDWIDFSNGQASITLPDPHDPGIAPQGWTPVVEVDTDVFRAKYPVEIPEGSASTTITNPVPAVEPPNVQTYALVNHTHEGGGGGGAVASVNGLTGVVVLGAAEVGAPPTSRQVLAGTGLSGGGTLAVDQTLSLSSATITSLAKADTAVQPAQLPDSPDDIGAAAAVHTHTAAQITDFTTAVDTRVQLIVDAAPSALDTLNELAAALNDDPNFAATVTTALAGKQPLDSDLTTIAALAPADGALIQRIAGAWGARSLAGLKSDLGVNLVDNTSDLNKPISTATQTALNGKLSRPAVVAHATTGVLKTAWPSLCGNGANPWTVCPTTYRVTVPAQVGDKLELVVGLILGTPTATGDAEFDIASINNTTPATPTILRYLSTGTSTQDPLGFGGLYAWSGTGRRFATVPKWIVTSDDLISGTVTLAVLYKAAGSGLSAGAASYGSTIDLTNLGG